MKQTCEDPYQNGCKDSAMYYRPKLYSDRPDTPEYLCSGCYIQLAADNQINEDEWGFL